MVKTWIIRWTQKKPSIPLTGRRWAYQGWHEESGTVDKRDGGADTADRQAIWGARAGL